MSWAVEREDKHPALSKTLPKNAFQSVFKKELKYHHVLKSSIHLFWYFSIMSSIISK